MHSGKLILLPNVIDDSQSIESSLPASVSFAVKAVDGIIAESEKAARKYLRKFISHEEMQKKTLRLLNEHTKQEDLFDLIAPLLEGKWLGLLTDAGLPCLADPGAQIVSLARARGVIVEAIAGPSSIILAVQLSGLPSQRFGFHGYLPRENPDLGSMIHTLEKRSQEEKAAQYFIEAPYRSQKLFDELLAILRKETLLFVASNLTGPGEMIVSAPVSHLKKQDIRLGKSPCIFGLYA